MSWKPHKAFILCAGKGTRLRPYTETQPKPLMEVGGRAIIDRALDHLEAAGVTDVTVNLHYKADALQTHLQDRDSPRFTFSEEEELLDTGGGVKKALESMGDEPFYLISGDAVWTDGPSEPALERLAKHWDPKTMDILLLLQPLEMMHLTHGVGDYDLDNQGRAIRSTDKKGAFMFTSIRITKPDIFDAAPDGAFSYLDLMDRAQEQGRLYGLVHDGDWHHISTPDELDAVNAAYKRKRVA